MIVVVVIPLTVVETSLTTVLDELPPPPEPELPPADCEDEVADVEEVAGVDDVDDVAEEDDVAADDDEAVDGVAITAAEDEAIALIDMKTSPEGSWARRRLGACSSPSTRTAPKSGVGTATKYQCGQSGADRSGRPAFRPPPHPLSNFTQYLAITAWRLGNWVLS
ncbi:hypothetical protein [Bradyrhizobium sp. McL0616]|uniref:hypothetical protein n=1 Tax=Bradyrhizobium sp. McL0616 TaxID=3415674 RepID=UPI003CE9FB07